MSRGDNGSRIRPERLSLSEIAARAKRLTDSYFRACGLPLDIISISFDAVYDQIIYPQFGIKLYEDHDLGFDEAGKKILGAYDPTDDACYIDRSLDHSDPRRPFTCWHEVGHAMLQGKWLRRELSRLRRQGVLVTTESSLDMATSDVLEWQANNYAAHAAAPTCLLALVIDQVFRPTRFFRFCGPGTYTLDVMGRLTAFEITSLNDLCRQIARPIQRRFGFLSIEALSYRIEQLPIFNDVTKPAFHLHRVVPSMPAYTPMAPV
ncbi:MAG TPA: hypothetical protein VMF30_05515 [Pirellulales bacterium]|nr:hypothetical protein [Pirellulales bacterium]